MIYRSLGGAVNGSTLQLTPLLNTYFMLVHVPIAILVMSMEIAVFALGLWQLKTRTANRWHGKIAKALFFIWWFAFLSGEILYVLLYMI